MTPEEVLAFWFAAVPGTPGYGRMREVWFEKDAAFDDEVRRMLARPHQAAWAGALDGWTSTGRGALALVILLDQVPRNIFRGLARAYACDAKARSVAAAAVARGHDRALLPAERLFLYLPFEHSELPADQARALELFAALEAFPETTGVMKTARRHAEIIQHFGRFPHRNAALGRTTTREEAAFLAEPESSF
ncbi:MAG: DUF924 family protein [Alphaproteobacteria bacterium]